MEDKKEDKKEDKTVQKEQQPATPTCGICGRPKVRTLGFGGDYKCPICSQFSAGKAGWQ